MTTHNTLGALERETLGQLIINPQLFESSDLLRADLFSTPDLREAFAACSWLWEELRPEVIDPGVLVEKTGLPLDFILSLVSGNYRPDPINFAWRVKRLHLKQTSERILKLAQDEGQHLVSTGEIDGARLEELRGLFLELDEKPAAGPNFAARKAAGIETRPVTWMWPGVIPVGMPTALEGDPGVGKTFVAADVVSRVTRGHLFPSYLQGAVLEPAIGSVVYITSEGVPDRILVPRLVAAGADLERVEIIEGIYDMRGEFEILDVNQHLPALARRIKGDPSIKLLVIDPLASHLSPKLNMNSSLEMRQAMDCVARFAEEASCAVLVLMHLNKDDRKAAIHRAAGSGQIMAAVKSAWAVVKKPDDENNNRRYFGPVKSNLAPFKRSMSFEIQDTTITFSDGTKGNIGRITWNHEPEDFDLQAAISPGAFELKSKVGAAVTFLRERLATGPQHIRDLIREAEGLGITKDNLWKAKRKEGIEDGREGYGKPSIWFYPASQEAGIQ